MTLDVCQLNSKEVHCETVFVPGVQCSIPVDLLLHVSDGVWTAQVMLWLKTDNYCGWRLCTDAEGSGVSLS